MSDDATALEAAEELVDALEDGEYDRAEDAALAALGRVRKERAGFHQPACGLSDRRTLPDGGTVGRSADGVGPICGCKVTTTTARVGDPVRVVCIECGGMVQ